MGAKHATTIVVTTETAAAGTTSFNEQAILFFLCVHKTKCSTPNRYLFFLRSFDDTIGIPIPLSCALLPVMSHTSTPSSSTTTTTPTSSAAAAINSFATITSDDGATPTSMPFGKAVESVDVCVETGKIAVGCSSLTGDSWEGSISVHFNGRTRTWNCGGGVSCVRWYDATHLLTADDASSTVSLWCPDDSSQWGHAEHDDIHS
ncbi:hypothetical protein Pelo_18950 [Pelomyxa schiedti]|nr:hypothetical protein Pelo_18950 [Pelomyxa schiedti]